MRLIDADKVEGKLRNIIPKIENLKNEFYNAPTIEVEQVRHGRWIEPEEYTGHTEWHCSYCGDVVCTICGYPSANYCPNCGAKMRGEADE